jgi:hypothetical protein
MKMLLAQWPAGRARAELVDMHAGDGAVGRAARSAYSALCASTPL